MNVTSAVVGGNSSSMRFARILLIAHFAALGFGLGGLLIALPHPELWVENPAAAPVFEFGMRYAGSLHIVLGAAAMFIFGVAVLGWRRTGIFFLASTALSLGAELLGTISGLPFMAVSRLLWRRDAAITADYMWFPFAVYVSNVGFAIALSASVGLWLPIILAVLLGLIPASLVLFRTTRTPLPINRRIRQAVPPS